ncbi:M23 family metallopeptidase [Cellulomonas sp. SLBN-39]|uniref:M23 family metallopeptidase n=1 Tax=Cellulomonas sp. SLBN-39 TaxID=2768446 RepID=UPI0011538FB6|nr:M23 family metallopeptidase [Cellulomonas sp. SLBN-39]TQL01114.1 murein DD-endopeptidase MepM/ murein hydrolase activator NlpD [Cellulomonas sp. SLBN-39]
MSHRTHRLVRAATAAAAALAVVLPAVVAGPALADDLENRRTQTEQKIAEADERAGELAAALEDLEGELADTVAELAEIEAQMPAAQERLDAAVAAAQEAQRLADEYALRLQDAEAEEVEVAEQIDVDRSREDEVRATIGQMAREAYRGGRDVSGMSVMLDAQSSEEFVERYGLVSTAMRTQAQVLGDLQTLVAENENAQVRLAAVREKVAELKAEADAALAQAQQREQEAAEAKAELEDLQEQQTAKLASIEDQKAEAEAQVKAQERARSSLASDLAKIVQEQREQREAAADAGSGGSGGGSAQPPAAPAGAMFANPTAHSPIYVTSEYGMRLHPVLGYYRMHAGIDLRDRCGEPVYAGRSGTVQWARFRSGYGNQVMIDHGWVNGSSLMSSYNHMSVFTVGAGSTVSAGQLIGYAGNTGTSAACHLHFEVYINGATVNPRSYLGL